jgi:membrane fusion protein, multidrug efflux system
VIRVADARFPPPPSPVFFPRADSKTVRATRIVNWFKHHVVIGTLLGLVILFTVYELVSGVLVYSRDAYITTDVIGVAPQVSGPLSTLAVKDNQLVQQGDLLIKIDPEPFQLDLDRLQANLELARATEERAKEEVSTASDRIASQQAQLDDAKAAFERATELRKSGNIDQQDLDNARRTFDVATAQLRAAQASRVTAEREIVPRRFAWPRLAALRQC